MTVLEPLLRAAFPDASVVEVVDRDAPVAVDVGQLDRGYPVRLTTPIFGQVIKTLVLNCHDPRSNAADTARLQISLPPVSNEALLTKDSYLSVQHARA